MYLIQKNYQLHAAKYLGQNAVLVYVNDVAYVWATCCYCFISNHVNRFKKKYILGFAMKTIVQLQKLYVEIATES